MANQETNSDLEKAWAHYEKIRDSLNGLYEILNMNLDEENIFYQCAVDNLETLKDTIIDLLKRIIIPQKLKSKCVSLNLT